MNSNAAIAITGNDTTYTTTGFLFFTGVLVWQSSTGVIKSGFYAEPVGSGSYQIYWYDDTSSASTGGVPLAIKSVAPASASNKNK